MIYWIIFHHYFSYIIINTFNIKLFLMGRDILINRISPVYFIYMCIAK